MEFEITQETLLWVYGLLHVLFGLVTHYHSVAQVRTYNKERRHYSDKVPSWKMLFWFAGRMLWGLPMFIVTRILSPIGNKWHMTAWEIKQYNVPAPSHG